VINTSAGAAQSSSEQSGASQTEQSNSEQESAAQEALSDLPASDLSFNHHSTKAQIQESETVHINSDTQFTVDATNTSCELHFDTEELAAACEDGAEYYLVIKGLNFVHASKGNATILTAQSSVSTAQVWHYLEGSKYYANQHDYLLNLGYSKEAMTTATLTFSQPGTYYYDSFELVVQPMDDLDKATDKLAAEQIDTVDFGHNGFSATVKASDKRIAYFNIPYSEGWTATCNGKEVSVMQVNGFGLGVEIDEGTSELVFDYQTPYLMKGAYVSLAGLIGLACIIWLYRPSRRGRHAH